MRKKRVIIIGSGLAGLLTAYYLAKEYSQIDITVLTKTKVRDSNSYLAQGGVAVVLRDDDSFESHIKDTIFAGQNYGDKKNIEILVKEGRERILELIDDGMKFDLDNHNNLDFGLEGAHSIARVIHSGHDQTGKFLIEFILSEVKKFKNITIIEDAYVFDYQPPNQMSNLSEVTYLDFNEKKVIISGDFVVMATGGIGGLYEITTNITTNIGDGIVMAQKSGAKLKDMEYIQYHPTLFNVSDSKKSRSFLISEAVRGAGGVLVDENNNRVMKNIHPLEDLAPRDVISNRLTQLINEGHQIFLDITNVRDFADKFPTIYEKVGDVKKISVRPGVHFLMGGILSDEHGKTNIPNLYAVGETACTGVHGKNRLASNSLLECMVFSKRAALDIIKTIKDDDNVSNF